MFFIFLYFINSNELRYSLTQMSDVNLHISNYSKIIISCPSNSYSSVIFYDLDGLYASMKTDDDSYSKELTSFDGNYLADFGKFGGEITIIVLNREKKILTSINHPNINKYLGDVIIPDQNKFILILEYCEYDLSALIYQSNRKNLKIGRAHV